jgi:hypothetical protein
MTAIAKVENEVGPSYAASAEMYPGVAAVDLTRGDLVYFNSVGKLVKSDAAAAGTAKCAGMVMTSVKAGQATSILKRGHVEGYTLTALAYGAKVYMAMGGAAGGLDTAAQTVSVVMASVVPLTDPAATKVLYFDADWKNL